MLNLPIPPEITLDPTSLSIEAGATATFTGAASGSDVQYQWQVDETDLPDETTDTLILNSVMLSQAGSYRFIASNAGGSVTSAPAVLTVTDTTAPNLDCAGDKSVECGTAWTFDPPMATDNSGEAVTVAVVDTLTNNFGCGETFTAQRAWQAVDSSGNHSVICTQTVEVVDTKPPTLECAANKTVECGTPWDFDPPYATDECVFSSLVFNNASNDLAYRFNPFEVEVGDEIVLAGTARHLKEFVFEYWGLNSNQVQFAGNVKARVRFYANDGDPYNGYATPGTVLYDSGLFGVDTTTRSTLTIDNFVTDATVPLVSPVPDSFTWTVQFSGLDDGDAAGVDLFSPATLGLDYTDYWEHDPAGWTLKTNPVVSVDFAAQVIAAQEDVTVTVLSTSTNHNCGKHPGGHSHLAGHRFMRPHQHVQPNRNGSGHDPAGLALCRGQNRGVRHPVGVQSSRRQ